MSEYSFDRVKTLLCENSEFIEGVLEEYLSYEAIGTTPLADAMRYSVLGGGKRIRAFLTMTAAQIFGGEERAAAPFAAAIEMIHAYSLIHDDLPAMDNDDMRRGKPSCHKAFGEAVALLAGDSLLSLAFQTIASNEYATPAATITVGRSYGRLSGVLGMAGGQELDLSGTIDNYEKLCHMYNLKTGALICAALFAGYYAATDEHDEEILDRLQTYGVALGLAFQIQDDVLDVIGDEALVGKPIGSDEKNDKHTSTYYMTTSEAIEEYRGLTETACRAIESVPGGEVLAELARYLCTRKF